MFPTECRVEVASNQSLQNVIPKSAVSLRLSAHAPGRLGHAGSRHLGACHKIRRGTHALTARSLAAARDAVYAPGAFAKAIRGTGPAREAKAEQAMEDCGAGAWCFQQNVEMK